MEGVKTWLSSQVADFFESLLPERLIVEQISTGTTCFMTHVQ
jgi:hypothetical protein